MSVNISAGRLARLNNPAWHALVGSQQDFATGSGQVRRYRRGILPFASCEFPFSDNLLALDPWLNAGEIFYLIGELPPIPSHWTLLKELPCVQMVLNTGPLFEAHANVTTLTAVDKTDIFNLINKVQPGYYEPESHRLGNYCGIREDGKLVAVAGERMKLQGLTEISAICTDPDYLGRKYAQHLIAHLCRINIKSQNIPFLHVLQTNARAIRLYEYMGFTIRRNISFWQLQRGGASTFGP